MCTCYWCEMISVTRETLLGCIILGFLFAIFLYLLFEMLYTIFKH